MIARSTACHTAAPARPALSAAKPKAWLCAALALALALLVGCRNEMHDQPKYRPLAESAFFHDGSSARQLPDGVVAHGHTKLDELYYTGKVNGQLATQFPLPVTKEVLSRGQERFNIFCSPCHGRLGNGQGMIVQRGFRSPPSFHLDRLRTVAPGHFFDVMTNGFGVMPSYASRVPVDDRWKIAAYIRALQASQNATMADVPPDQQQKLTGAPK